VWHFLLPFKSNFNKTETAIFPIQSMLSKDFSALRSPPYCICVKLYFSGSQGSWIVCWFDVKIVSRSCTRGSIVSLLPLLNNRGCIFSVPTMHLYDFLFANNYRKCQEVFVLMCVLYTIFYSYFNMFYSFYTVQTLEDIIRYYMIMS